MYHTSSLLHLIPSPNLYRLPKTQHDLGPIVLLTSSLFTVSWSQWPSCCHYISWHTAVSGSRLLSLCLETLHKIECSLNSVLHSDTPNQPGNFSVPVLASNFCFPSWYLTMIYFYLTCIFESYSTASSWSTGDSYSSALHTQDL